MSTTTAARDPADAALAGHEQRPLLDAAATSDTASTNSTRTGSSDVQGLAGASVANKTVDDRIDKEVLYEFGGPWGAIGIMIFSPCIMYFLWDAVEFHEGHLNLPTSFSDLVSLDYFRRFGAEIAERATPTLEHAFVYWTFLLFEAALYVL
ncbi:hypothetical protein HK405_008157, partial [Cladochytrium tenue]